MLFVVLLSGDAAAYCRTTTCDPDEEVCDKDADGCIIEGSPLWWRGGRLAMWVDSAGSPQEGISASETAAALAEALDAWAQAVCQDGSSPRLEGFVAGQLANARVGFDLKDLPSNRNVVVYEEMNWDPKDANIVALTSTTFDTRTGQILDADTELNGVFYDFAPEARDVDLLAVLTHETGHAFGLDHSNVPGATMQPETRNAAFEDLRTLAQDDMDGICEIYPQRDEGGCSCAVPGRAAPHPSGAWILVGMGLLCCSRRGLPRPASELARH